MHNFFFKFLFGVIYASFLCDLFHNDFISLFAVKVPLDAYMMDFVFSEREDGGIFDNKDGTDYHIPVLGGIVKEPPMHIVHVAVEMAPIAKVTILEISSG